MGSHRATPRLKTRLQRLGIVILVALGLGSAVGFGIAFCPMALVLHIPCPGCGMTRATLAALRGDFAASFRFHPLALVMVPLLGAYATANAISYIRHGVSQIDTVLAGKWFDRLLLLLLFAMLTVWIARFFGAFGGPVPV